MFEKLKDIRDIIFNKEKIPNVLLCTGISDALGVPFETLKCNDPKLLAWDNKSFLASSFHKTASGEWSDDTQLSIIVAESLIDNKKFNPADLSKRYVDWLYGGKARGVGGTIKLAVENLKNGTHWSKSGIEGSVGSGSAMRSAPFGLFFANKDFSDMYNAVKIDSAITHKSVDAEVGALAVAITVYMTANKRETELPSYLSVHLPECKTKSKIFKAYDMSDTINPVNALKKLGASGRVTDLVPSAMYCFWRCNRFEDAVRTAIRASGDTDTRAAIVGAMVGAKTKLGDIPFTWVKDVEKSSYLRDLDTKLSG